MTSANNAQPRVAFQGERGAFSEEAAVKLLGEQIELVPRPTFEAMFASIRRGRCGFCPRAGREQPGGIGPPQL